MDSELHRADYRAVPSQINHGSRNNLQGAKGQICTFRSHGTDAVFNADFSIEKNAIHLSFES